MSGSINSSLPDTSTSDEHPSSLDALLERFETLAGLLHDEFGIDLSFLSTPRPLVDSVFELFKRLMAVLEQHEHQHHQLNLADCCYESDDPQQRTNLESVLSSLDGHRFDQQLERLDSVIHWIAGIDARRQTRVAESRQFAQRFDSVVDQIFSFCEALFRQTQDASEQRIHQGIDQLTKIKHKCTELYQLLLMDLTYRNIAETQQLCQSVDAQLDAAHQWLPWVAHDVQDRRASLFRDLDHLHTQRQSLARLDTNLTQWISLCSQQRTSLAQRWSQFASTSHSQLQLASDSFDDTLESQIKQLETYLNQLDALSQQRITEDALTQWRQLYDQIKTLCQYRSPSELNRAPSQSVALLVHRYYQQQLAFLALLPHLVNQLSHQIRMVTLLSMHYADLVCSLGIQIDRIEAELRQVIDCSNANGANDLRLVQWFCQSGELT